MNNMQDLLKRRVTWNLEYGDVRTGKCVQVSNGNVSHEAKGMAGCVISM